MLLFKICVVFPRNPSHLLCGGWVVGGGWWVGRILTCLEKGVLFNIGLFSKRHIVYYRSNFEIDQKLLPAGFDPATSRIPNTCIVELTTMAMLCRAQARLLERKRDCPKPLIFSA